MKKIALLTLVINAQFPSAQPLNWAEHIAPIFFKKCASCHHDGGIAPFSLIAYQPAAQHAGLIKWAVESGHMPPWPPNPDYRHFAFERTLTQQEKNDILNWIDMDFPSGNMELAPDPPVFQSGGDLPGTPDMVLKIPTYTVLPTTQDDYRCFVIKNTLTQDRYITAWEVVPGNRSIVHHVLVYQDNTGQCAAADAATPGPGYSCFGNACDGAEPFGAWAPGGNPLVYPAGMGIKLKAGTDIVIELHYPEGSAGEIDSTEVHFFFAPTNTGMREVLFDAVADPFFTIQNGPFLIQANTVKTFNTRLNFNFGTDMTLLRVLPHMHLLGKSMKSWVVSPQNDTIPLIHIPKWDFHWQGMYGFQKPLRIKNGSKLYSTFTYDNTSFNPNNPNSPPQLVRYGNNTTDEMLFLFVEYLPYRPGDENIVMDNSILTPIHEVPKEFSSATLYPSRPNPMTGEMSIPFHLTKAQSIQIQIFDIAGRVVAVPLEASFLSAGHHTIKFKGELKAGMYFTVLMQESGMKKMIKFVAH